MNKVELIPCSNADELAQVAARTWLEEIATANAAGQTLFVALSGGRITLKFFVAVIGLSRARNVSLRGLDFFWADERCVPPADAESNFGAAQEMFFRPLEITAGKIHRICGELAPERAAELATTELKRLVPCNAAGQPALDLIFLGMGEDGHVASLFPAGLEGDGTDALVYRAITNSPKPPPNRVTLGYAAIAAARQVWVLASGSGKEAALRASLVPEGTTPLARVIQLRSQTKIFTDIHGG